MWWSRVLVRDINLYSCHNVQVRSLQHILFCALVQMHFIHPPLQIHVCYLEMRVSCWCCICHFTTWQLPQRYRYLACKMYIPSYNTSCTRWYNDAAYYSIFNSKEHFELHAIGIPLPPADTGCFGCNHSCWTPCAVGHIVKVGRAQESQSHRKSPRSEQQSVTGQFETNL